MPFEQASSGTSFLFPCFCPYSTEWKESLSHNRYPLVTTLLSASISQSPYKCKGVQFVERCLLLSFGEMLANYKKAFRDAHLLVHYMRDERFFFRLFSLCYMMKARFIPYWQKNKQAKEAIESFVRRMLICVSIV